MDLNLKQYFGKIVEVVDIDGNVYKGLVDVYASPQNNDVPEAAISSAEGWWLNASDIKQIKVIG